MKLQKKELMHAIAMLYNALTEGKSEEDAADEFGLDLAEIQSLKSKMLDLKAKEVKEKPIEHVYVEYMISQMVSIKTLDEMIESFRNDTKSSNAAVGAIRTRSEILDKIFNKGQDCGIIQKAPNKTESLFGILIADLTDAKLDKLFKEKVRELDALMVGSGSGDILSLPAPTKIYDGPSIEIEEEKKEKIKVIDKPKRKKKKKIKKTKVIKSTS